jgi:peptidylamidoglycolate lyase
LIVNYLIICLFIILISCTQQNNNQSPSHHLVPNWPSLPKDCKLSQVTGVAIDSFQNVFLIHRAGREWSEPFPDSTISLSTVLLLDGGNGTLMKSWGENIFIMPHGLSVDHKNNFWITDVALHQVFKFSHDGHLLMKLGEASVSGNDSLHFNRPTDVAVSEDGKIYVSDGYLNSRIACFSPSGKYLFEWGKKGNKPGEFDVPHGIALDYHKNVYVADRENNRIQKFDSMGKFILEWKNEKATQLYSVAVNKDQPFAIDYHTIGMVLIKGSDILQFDSTLKILNRFGRSGNYQGPISRYHDIAADKMGNLYVGDILNNTIQKFQVVKQF